MSTLKAITCDVVFRRYFLIFSDIKGWKQLSKFHFIPLLFVCPVSHLLFLKLTFWSERLHTQTIKVPTDLKKEKSEATAAALENLFGVKTNSKHNPPSL